MLITHLTPNQHLEVPTIIVFNYKCTSNGTQVKTMTTGGYNNIYPQSGVCTKYVPMPGRVQTKTITRQNQPRDKKGKLLCMQLL